MVRKTGFVWDECYAWHDTGSAAGYVPAGGFVQPLGHIENPDGKRRLADLIAVSGLRDQLFIVKPRYASQADLSRFHTEAYINKVKKLSAENGGDAGELTPFGRGSYEIACLSAGGCIELAHAVWKGEVDNGYVLNRPPGHHAEADRGRGFCIFGNGVIAIKSLQAAHNIGRIAVVDWDVHHGNGAQKAFYSDSSVLTISIHEDGNYPADSGRLDENGSDKGLGFNLNIPMPSGSGHEAYLAAFREVVLPALQRYKPEMIVVHSGFDASIMDPLGRMLLHSESYRQLTRMLMQAAEQLCGGKLVMFHEGGYSLPYVPFCGLAVIEELADFRTSVQDPYMDAWRDRPAQRIQAHQRELIGRAAELVMKIPS